MKTLIITGTAKTINSGVQFDITLFGQSPEQPEVQYITSFAGEFIENSSMEALARQIYAKYFKTDANNLISMQNIIMI
jgi:hypothetical protein